MTVALHQVYDIVLRRAERLRVVLPAETTAGYEHLLRIVERCAEGPGVDDYRQAVADAATQGSDPLLDPEVVELAARRGLSDGDVKAALHRIAGELLCEHAPAMFAAFGERFDEAAGMLAASAAALPPVARLKQGPPAGQNDNWDRARYAETVMTELQTLWKHLSVSAGFPSAAHRTVLIVAEVPPEQWFELGLDRNPMSPWQAAVARLEFSLALPETFRARSNAIGEFAGSAKQREQDRARERRVHQAAKADPLAYLGSKD